MQHQQPPPLSRYSIFTLTVGLIALIAAFTTHKFALLFVTAGALWVLVLLLLYRAWWPGLPRVPGRKRTYKGLAVLSGFLIFTATWYLIIHFDPSLK